jgi:hypothetical protein
MIKIELKPGAAPKLAGYRRLELARRSWRAGCRQANMEDGGILQHGQPPGPFLQVIFSTLSPLLEAIHCELL